MPKFKKQADTNTRRIRQLMRDVRNDVSRRTKNSKNLDVWLKKLSPYVNENCFTVGVHNEAALNIVKNISKTVEMSKLPSGVNSEIVKGIISETTMHYVTNLGEDMKTELRQIAVESYNNKLAPRETAKLMESKIDSLTRTRAECIARTETMRGANLSNLVISKENGANSYTISCDEEACDHCLTVYKDEAGEDIIFDINDTDNFPPFHPNCRCTPRFSTKTVEERQETMEE